MAFVPVMLDLSVAAVIIILRMKPHLEKLVGYLKKQFSRTKASDELPQPVLLPLTPKYDPVQHGVYFDMLRNALGAEDGRNIALTGSYGAGKSSILDEIVRRNKRKVVAVSLSTLGLESAPATTDPDLLKASTTTNQIQKEIVKQILYSQDPHKTPGSRYSRMTRFRAWRALLLAAILSVPVVVTFHLTGWTDSLVGSVPFLKQFSLLVLLDDYGLRHLVLGVLSAAFFWGVFALLYNQFQIAKFGAGAATIELSKKSATYFDEYLDEIVYFFDATKKDLVIFEDIDRFEDSEIFETLRSLNSILNGAQQLRGRRIRFIYAMKDSIFDPTNPTRRTQAGVVTDSAVEVSPDPVEGHVPRANRTKFFDYIIPVVPFITHRNARDLLKRTLDDQLVHKVSTKLTDLAAQHVPDMRLLKNVRNEFSVFKRQVIDLGVIELSETPLFAMMLYKNTHLADFEKIRLGQSDLDVIYRQYRLLVAANLGRIDSALREARLQRRRATASASHSDRLGKKFGEQFATMTGLLTLRHIALAGTNYDEAALRKPGFWEALADSDGAVTVNFYDVNYGTNRSISLTKQQIETMVGEPVNSSVWLEEQRDKHDKTIASLLKDREFVSSAGMSELMRRDSFWIVFQGELRSFGEIVDMQLKSQLAIALVGGGFIDHNFTLYTSMFQGDRVSANATNFILKSVEPKIADTSFKLKAKEVQSVIEESGRAFLEEPSSYNVNVLDYLLKRDPAGADIVVKRLAADHPEDRVMTLAYLETGAHANLLVERLVACWNKVFSFLISDAGLEESRLQALVDIALRSASSEVDYVLDQAVHDYLTEAHKALPLFTDEKLSAAAAAHAASILLGAKVYVPTLAYLASPIRDRLIANGSYLVTRANLDTALGGSPVSLSLDRIAASNDAVYRRALQDLPSYLSALHSDEYSVKDPDSLVQVLLAVIDVRDEQLAAVLERADPACIIVDLDEIPFAYWEIIAEQSRFKLTIHNLSRYLEEIGLDAYLGQMLNEAAVIEEVDGVEEPRKIEIASAILAAKDQVPSAEHRARLVDGLDLTDHLSISNVPVEAGELVGHLLDRDLVPDEPATFAAIPAADNAGRAFAISKSSGFAGYMTVNEVTPANVGFLIDSPIVPGAVKNEIIERFSEFTVGATLTNLRSIASYAIEHKRSLDWTEVSRLASEGAGPEIVVPLIERFLPNPTEAHLAPVLTSLGGKFAELATRNGRHPRIPMTTANWSLASHLVAIGVAKSRSEVKGEIKVNMKR